MVGDVGGLKPPAVSDQMCDEIQHLIEQEFCKSEMSFSVLQIERQMINTTRLWDTFLSFFFFYDFIVYILWINKNLDESVNIQKFTKPPFFLFIFDFLFLLYFSISVFTKLICLLALEVC